MTYLVCPACNGTGTLPIVGVTRGLCSLCNGRGWIEEKAMRTVDSAVPVIKDINHD